MATRRRRRKGWWDKEAKMRDEGATLLEAVDFPNVRGMIEVVGATRVSRLSFPLVTMVNLKDCSPALSSLQVPGADWLTLVSCPGLEVVSTSHHMKKLKVEDCGQLDLSDLPEPVTQRSK